MTTLFIKDENGEYTKADTDQIISGARSRLRQKFRKGTIIRQPADTKDFLRAELSNEKNEVFCMMHLCNRHSIIKFDRLFTGTIDGASVYPRVVVQRALELNTAAVIFAHCHPSGVAEPSTADERITTRLKAALELVDVRLLDHMIAGGDTITSMASRGLI